MVEINEYLQSGILEAYVLGSASPKEAAEVLYLKQQFPQVQQALTNVETDLESIGRHMAIIPPPDLWMKIEAGINGLIASPDPGVVTKGNPSKKRSNNSRTNRGNYFVEVEAESNHMRVHKVWRWVFGAVFLLGKIFLACAIYFYFESRSVSREIEQLKTEIKLHSSH